jgi:anti-anti-sigma factor
MDLALLAVPDLRDAVWLIRVTGDVDVDDTPRLVDALRTARQEGTGSVILDLTRTRYVSSGGVHAMLSAQRRLAAAARRLAVVCDAAGLSMTVPMSELSEVLEMHPDVDTVLSAEPVSRTSRRVS